MAPLVLVQTRKFGALDVPQKPKPAPKPAPKPVEDEDLNAKSFSFLGGLVASSMFDADADATPPPPTATTTASALLQRCANGDAAADALAEASYWRAFEAPSARRAPAADFDVAAARAALGGGDGYFAARDASDSALWRDCADVVRNVEAAGWPPVFALLCDAPWRGVARSWDLARRVLGDCVLEPSIFIWSLRRHGTTNPARKTRCARVGENFGLPHRDFTYGDAHFPDGAPKVLNTWLPFTEAAADNGCLWVVPREFDACYADDGHYDHLRPALPGFEAGATKLRFPIGAARPVPLAPGDVLCWHNVIHWGGLCGAGAREPRISLAATFRRADAPPTHLVADGALDGAVPAFDALRADPGAAPRRDRARLVAHALLMYSDWYDLDGGALPDAFFDLLGAERPRADDAAAAAAGATVLDASGCYVDDY